MLAMMMVGAGRAVPRYKLSVRTRHSTKLHKAVGVSGSIYYFYLRTYVRYILYCTKSSQPTLTL